MVRINEKILKIFILMLCFAIVPFSLKANNKEIQEILVVAKMTGLCGAFQQMASFQSSTKMNGGNDFIERFAATESARLGYKNAESFIEACQQSIKSYDNLYNELEKGN